MVVKHISANDIPLSVTVSKLTPSSHTALKSDGQMNTKDININVILGDQYPLTSLINCNNIKGDTIGLYICNIDLYN